MSFKQLSNLDRLCAVQPQYHIDLCDDTQLAVLAVDRDLGGSKPRAENFVV